MGIEKSVPIFIFADCKGFPGLDVRLQRDHIET